MCQVAWCGSSVECARKCYGNSSTEKTIDYVEKGVCAIV